MNLKLGLFGGSFNPVTLGHLLVARAALEELQLDRLVFIPAAHSPFKPNAELAPAPERMRMLRLALAGHTWCEIDDQEIQRGGISYTIDTVRDYTRRFRQAQLFWLIGGDLPPTLPLWREAVELASSVEFIVIPRPGEPSAHVPPPFRGHSLRGFPFGVSSSQVRARVKAGLPVDLLVGGVVAGVIREKRLYL